MSNPTRAVFTIYTRRGCHLCDDLLHQLQPLTQTHPFDFITIDVDSTAELKAQYGHLVPLVMHQDQPVCHYFLDQAALLQAIEQTR